jgi:hypothetical protein
VATQAPWRIGTRPVDDRGDLAGGREPLDRDRHAVRWDAKNQFYAFFRFLASAIPR